MDPLEVVYDNIEAVPEQFRGLYAEKDGKAVLSHVNGIKTQQDVLNVQEALRKEREDHAAAKQLVTSWKALGDDPKTIQTKLDRMAELELAAGGNLDEGKLNSLVEARLAQKTSPLERQLRDTSTLVETLTKENETLKTSMQRRDMNEAVRYAATEMKVLATAIPDVEMIAANYLERDPTTGAFIVKADARGATPGSDIRGFLKDMQKVRPHWWPASQGGGGGGGGGFGGEDNPWSAKGWNLTKQGEIVRQKGMAEAELMAKAAGSKVGSTRPPVSK